MMSERQAFENRELLELQTILVGKEPMPPSADLVANCWVCPPVHRGDVQCEGMHYSSSVVATF
jgi:hypothetical protein